MYTEQKSQLSQQFSNQDLHSQTQPLTSVVGFQNNSSFMIQQIRNQNIQSMHNHNKQNLQSDLKDQVDIISKNFNQNKLSSENYLNIADLGAANQKSIGPESNDQIMKISVISPRGEIISNQHLNTGVNQEQYKDSRQSDITYDSRTQLIDENEEGQLYCIKEVNENNNENADIGDESNNIWKMVMNQGFNLMKQNDQLSYQQQIPKDEGEISQVKFYSEERPTIFSKKKQKKQNIPQISLESFVTSEESKQERLLREIQEQERMHNNLPELIYQCALFYKKQKITQEDQQKFGKMIKGYVQIKVIPKAINEIGQLLLKNGFFAIAFIKYMILINNNQTQIKDTLFQNYSGKIQSNKEEFQQQYNRWKQSIIKANNQIISQFKKVNPIQNIQQSNVNLNQIININQSIQPTGNPSLQLDQSFQNKLEPQKIKQICTQFKDNNILSKKKNYTELKDDHVAFKREANLIYELELNTNLNNNNKKMQVSQIKNFQRSAQTDTKNDDNLGSVNVPVVLQINGKTDVKQVRKSKRLMQQQHYKQKNEQYQKLIKFKYDPHANIINSALLKTPRSPSKKHQKKVKYDDQQIMQSSWIKSHCKQLKLKKQQTDESQNKMNKKNFDKNFYRPKELPKQIQKIICKNINYSGNYALVKLKKITKFELGHQYALVPLNVNKLTSKNQIIKDLETAKTLAGVQKLAYLEKNQEIQTLLKNPY